MSDQDMSTGTANPIVASAQQALAFRELSDAVAGMRKKFKTLWIAFAVLAVVTVIVAVFAIGPRFGLNIGGTRTGFPTGAFQRNGTSGNPGTTGTQGGTNDQAPVPPTQ
jgi:hypothetical protein